MQRTEARQYVRRSQVIAAGVLCMAGLVPLLPLGASGPEADGAPVGPMEPVAPPAARPADPPALPSPEDLAARLIAMLPAPKEVEPPKEQPKPPPTEPGPPTPPPPAPPPPIRYIGGIFNPDFTRAIVVLNGLTQKLLAEGAELENGARLVKIRPTELVIRDAGGNESTVPLSKRDPAMGVAAAPGAAAPPQPPAMTPDRQAMADLEAAKARAAVKAAAARGAARGGLRGAADEAQPVLDPNSKGNPGGPNAPGAPQRGPNAGGPGGKPRAGADPAQNPAAAGAAAIDNATMAPVGATVTPVGTAPGADAAYSTGKGPAPSGTTAAITPASGAGAGGGGIAADPAFAIRGRGRVTPAGNPATANPGAPAPAVPGGAAPGGAAPGGAAPSSGGGAPS